MIHTAQRLALALLLVVASAVSAAAQSGVAGTWLFTVSSPDMGQLSMTVVFEQDGSAVTGTIDLAAAPMLEAAELTDGTFEDGELSIGLDVAVDGLWYSTSVSADVDGDDMSGEIWVPDMGYGVPFTGKRQES
jgi:hypothetical protein